MKRPFSAPIGRALAVMLLATMAVTHAAAEPFDVTATTEIVVAPNADDDTRAAANDLAETLGRMTGHDFGVKEGDGKRGFAVGTADDFPDLGFDTGLDADDPTGRENYVVRSHRDGVHVLGATDLAVPHAVWGLLHTLGHRQYLPGPNWEHVPQLPKLTINLDQRESPAFIDRRIFPGGGLFDYDRDAVHQWRKRNRMGSGFRVGYTHVYDKIIHDLLDTFDAHPEYLALVDGQRYTGHRTGNKFCISNDDLRQLVIDWAIQKLESRPDIDGVSMEPSDGLNWCECEPCAAMGGVPDRVHILASQVAAALESHFDTPKYVGLYAYAAHSPPPSETVTVHPRVLVMVAKGFLRGGWTFERLLEAWRGRGNVLGARDYLSVYQWSKDMPGSGRATRRDYPVKELPFMHAQGARLYCGESEGNWGPAGFTYYLCTRVLWDLDTAERGDDIFDAFLDDMFGSAAGEMRRFYDLIDGSRSPLLSEDLVGRMYRHLGAARDASDDPDVQRRVDHLIFYTRYVEMYRAYQAIKPTDERQAAFENLIRFAWQISGTYMVHTREVHRILPKYDKKMKVPEEAYYRLPPDRNVWAQNPPLPDDAAERFLAEGIANNALFPFDPVSYSRDLVSAAPLALQDNGTTGTFGGGGRGTQQLYLWVGDPSQPLELQATGGQISHYRDRGDARLKLFKGDEIAGGEDEMPLDTASVPPDGEPHPVTLRTAEQGLHRIQIKDGGDRTELHWPEGLPLTWYADTQTSATYPGQWTLAFYVPRDAKTVSGYADSNRGQVVNADGKVVLDLSDALEGSGFFSVPVTPDQVGRVWWLRNCRGQRMLMTVPPCLARSAEELLLPREVVEADTP